MKSAFYCLALYVAIVANVFGQNQASFKPPMSVYAEGIGIGGLYSVNCDYRVVNNIALRAGFTAWNFDMGFANGSVAGFPFGINYIIGQERGFEIGVCSIVGTTKGKMFFSETNDSQEFAILAANLGYRFQSKDGGLIFRATVYPEMNLSGGNNNDKKFKITAGISIGFTQKATK